MALKTVKNGYKNSSFWNVRNGQQIYEVLLRTLSDSQCPSHCCRFYPTTRSSCADPTRNVCVGRSPLAFRRA